MSIFIIAIAALIATIIILAVYIDSRGMWWLVKDKLRGQEVKLEDEHSTYESRFKV